MYYRYKSKKRDNKLVKFLFIAVCLCVIIFLGYTYRSHLMFWKYSYNKLYAKISRIQAVKDPALRRTQLVELTKQCDGAKTDNEIDPDTFFLAGRAHYQLGEELVNRSFTRMVIDDALTVHDAAARREFMQAIKDIRKGFALLKKDDVTENHLYLARAMLYLNFASPNELYALVQRYDTDRLKGMPEQARVLATLAVMAGAVEPGLAIMRGYGAPEGVEGLLFLAALERTGKRYTSAIGEYKKVLQSSQDAAALKNAHANLGRIYYIQALYRESADHFEHALMLDKNDAAVKVQAGKAHAALGNKARATALWTEALAADTANEEVKKLLGAR
ncbi:MAG TPA: hypothetical protein PKM65_16075 [Spirochaetota bacterium]|nr:hypothetical protein [Spirochaetota bacterium]HNT11828.1 hypothetical protein [Spirochaetota bacterium]